MEMYKSVPEAIAIFRGLESSSIHTITECITGETMTGTPSDLVSRITEQDRATSGNISHGATTVEGWAIIEYAYSLD